MNLGCCITGCPYNSGVRTGEAGASWTYSPHTGASLGGGGAVSKDGSWTASSINLFSCSIAAIFSDGSGAVENFVEPLTVRRDLYKTSPTLIPTVERRDTFRNVISKPTEQEIDSWLMCMRQSIDEGNSLNSICCCRRPALTASTSHCASFFVE